MMWGLLGHVCPSGAASGQAFPLVCGRAFGCVPPRDGVVGHLCLAADGPPAVEEDSSFESVVGIVRRRADIPKVVALSRGKLARASMVAADPLALDAAMEGYE
eukprot:5352379-Amphidinium_carterae.2